MSELGVLTAEQRGRRVSLRRLLYMWCQNSSHDRCMCPSEKQVMEASDIEIETIEMALRNGEYDGNWDSFMSPMLFAQVGTGSEQGTE